MYEKDEVKLLQGGSFTDERGTLAFCNDFSVEKYKRMYTVTHPYVETVRAWQGHRFESKAFMALDGSFLMAFVKIDDFNNPSPGLKPIHYTLSAETNQVILVPKGYANGFKALTPSSRLLVFSDLGLEESLKDNIRFDAQLWMDWANEDNRL